MPTVTDATTIALLIQHKAVTNALKPLKAQQEALHQQILNQLKPGEMAQTGEGYFVKCHKKPKISWPNELLDKLDFKALRLFANITKKAMEAGLKNGTLTKKWVDEVVKKSTTIAEKCLEFSKP